MTKMVNNKQKSLRKKKIKRRRKIKMKPKTLPIVLMPVIAPPAPDLQRKRTKINHRKSMIIIKRINHKKNKLPQQNRNLMKVKNQPTNLLKVRIQNLPIRQSWKQLESVR